MNLSVLSVVLDRAIAEKRNSMKLSRHQYILKSACQKGEGL